MTQFLTPADEPRAFVVISSMRSGSTLLVRHLRQLPHGACFGEILRADFPDKHEWPRLAKRLDLPSDALDLHREHISRWWELVLSRTLARKRWAGSKIFSDHRRGDPLWDRFAEPDHRVFHLWRDSTFDTYVSLQLALATGEWKAPADGNRSAAEPRVTFDVEAYRGFRSHIREDIEAVRERYGGSDRYVELEYAQLTDLGSMTSLLSTLYGERVQLEERLERQRPRPKIEYVSNRTDAAAYEGDSLRSGFWHDD